MSSETPTIVIIDDSAGVRSLIRARLRISGQWDVLADGANGTEAIRLAELHRPDLLLLDTSMPEMDGLEALPGILAVSPHTRVAVYSGFEEQGLADRALEFGASAFIEKSLSIDVLSDELLAVLGTGRDLDGSASRRQPALSLVTPADWAAGADQTVLDEHLERFREVFDEAAIGMATMTLTGSLVRGNRALAHLMMCSLDELVGVDYGRLTSGNGDLLDRALGDINDRSVDLVNIEHDVAGTPGPRRVRASLAPVRDSSGQALYVFLQVQDITAQRAAEEKLLQSEARFRLLVEAVEDYAVFMLTPEGIVASWNAGAQRSKGYRAEEIVGQHFRIFYTRDKQREKHPERELEQALRDGRYQEEGWRVRKDGTQFWANVIITAMFDESGQHRGFAKVTRDVTERRLADQQRDEVQRALAEANESLASVNLRLTQAAEDQSQFLAVTAHELRNPAAVLGGSAQTLTNHWSDLTEEERDGLLHGMTTSADRLHHLLSDLLTASSLEADSLKLAIKPTVLSGVLKSASEAARATQASARIVVSSHDDIEVLADPIRLAQAVDNLIANALSHGAEPVRIDVGVRDSMAELRFRDGGKGVDPELRGRLFERFATGDGRAGTGLGLFIVRELARAHGGEAYYESATDEHPSGAFVLTMPLA